MQITYGSKHQLIERYKPNPKDSSDWTSHYKNSNANHSAWLLGNFIFNKNGLTQIREKVEKALSTSVTFEKCSIERSVIFDEFPRPSMRDMVIEGITKTKKSVFITIEAKASEPFGPTISSALKTAKKYVQQHKNSKREKRINKLYERLLTNTKEIETCQLRYQLFHATAATISADADYKIMIVLELNKSLSQNILQRNKKHFLDFLKNINAKEINLDENFTVYTGRVDGNEIKFIYLEVPMNDK